MKLEDSITIRRPVNRVFAMWADIEHYADWAAPVIERKKLTEGPVGVGTRFHAVDQWPGRKAEFEMEVTEFEQNKRLGARWFKPMEGSWSSQLKETPEGTQLDFQMEMNLPPIMKIFSPLLKPWAKKQNRGFMVSLKHHLEGTPE